MRAIHAIYENGRILFPWHPPELEGPVAVLVILPDSSPDEFEADLIDWDIHGEELPY